MKTLILFLSLFLIFNIKGQDANSAYEKGIEALRDSENNHNKIILAVKLLTEAELLYEKEGKEDKLTLVNSCLYWAKKKLTINDIDSLYSSREIKTKIEKAIKPIPENQGQ